MIESLQTHIDNLFELDDNFDKYEYIMSTGKEFNDFLHFHGLSLIFLDFVGLGKQ